VTQTPADHPGAAGAAEPVATSEAPDALVASARDHWGPRFAANGVPYADVQRLLGSIRSWSDWCREWSSAGAAHESLAEAASREGRDRSAAEHYATAAALYHFAKFVYVADPGQMREAHRSAVRCYDRAIAGFDRPGRKVLVPFDGAALHAVFRSPADASSGPFATVILIPGLDSTKEELRSTEELFLARGLATFTVDGPGQGEAEYDLPIRGDWEAPGAAIVDLLETMPEVDPARIGVWGVSLGGYYSARFASGEPRLKACVALCGPYDFGEIWDQLPQLTRDTFVYRSRAESDEAGRQAALGLSLRGRTASIRCPTLIISGRRDRLIPWQHQQRLHDETAQWSELLMLEQGNHGATNVLAEHRYRTADWMAARLG